MTRGRVVLVKHAQPLLDATKPARDWDLAVEGEEQSKRLGASLSASTQNQVDKFLLIRTCCRLTVVLVKHAQPLLDWDLAVVQAPGGLPSTIPSMSD